jgi:hypothetical protein
MAELVGVGCGRCTDRGPEEGDCTCGDCVTGGQQCLPNNPKNRTAQQIANMGTRRRYSNMSGTDSNGSMSVGAYESVPLILLYLLLVPIFAICCAVLFLGLFGKHC